MPQLGEIKQGREINYRNDGKYIWHACENCGKERWVPFIKNEVSCKLCFSCAPKGRQKLYFYTDKRERSRMQSQKWRRENPKRRREIDHKAWAKAKEEVLTHYGNDKLACVKCGFDDIRALSIDHINGRGEIDRKNINRRGGMLYFWLRKNNYPEGFQTLCMNCQFIKRIINNECLRKRGMPDALSESS